MNSYYGIMEGKNTINGVENLMIDEYIKNIMDKRVKHFNSEMNIIVKETKKQMLNQLTSIKKENRELKISISNLSKELKKHIESTNIQSSDEQKEMKDIKENLIKKKIIKK